MSFYSRVAETFSNATESLRVRDYRLFYTGQFMSFTGTWMRRTALGWLVFEITGHYDDLGYVFALMTLPLLLFSPWAGSLADRFVKKNMIMTTQFIAGILSFLLALLVWFDSISVIHIYLFAILSGTAFSFEVPARQAYIKELVGKEKLMNAIALNSAMINLTRILGPAMAGFLMYVFSGSSAGKALVFLIDGISYVVVLLMLYRIRNAGLPQPSKTPRGKSAIAEGLRTIKRTPIVMRALTLLFFMGVFGWSFQTLLPGIVQEQLQLKEIWFGVLMAAFGIGASIAAFRVASGSNKIRPFPSMVKGLVLMGSGLIALSFSVVIGEMIQSYLPDSYWFAGSAPYTLMLLFTMPAGFGAVTFLSTANSLVQTSIDDSVRGRVMGIWALSFGGSLPLGSLLAGNIAEVYFMGPMKTIMFSNIIMLAIMAFLLIRIRLSDSASEHKKQENKEKDINGNSGKLQPEGLPALAGTKAEHSGS